MRPAIALSLLTLWTIQAASATFEVVSIKRSPPDAHGFVIQAQPGGGLLATNITLKRLLTYAYNVQDFQISGGPAWINSEHYDVTAKPAPDSTPSDLSTLSEEQRKTFNQQLGERVQALLADRFHLILHRETREQTVYVLVVAKGGPKLKEAKQGEGPAMSIERGQITASGSPMRMLSGALENVLGRPVSDKSDLEGKYDFHLEWSPELLQSDSAAATPLTDAAPAGPSIFTALEQQLGLRLQSQKSFVERLVIDQIERPSEN